MNKMIMFAVTLITALMMTGCANMNTQPHTQKKYVVIMNNRTPMIEYIGNSK